MKIANRIEIDERVDLMKELKEILLQGNIEALSPWYR